MCDDAKAFKGYATWAYGESEMYSFGRQFRSYGYYPKWLPIYCSSCHGTKYALDFSDYELNTSADFFLVFSKKNQEVYKKMSTVPCHCVLAPFVWYRQSNRVGQLAEAKGTLVFPGHQTKEIDISAGVEQYIDFLKTFPDEFQPVCVCLHPVDIQKGGHAIYQKHGFPVYSAGNSHDQRFAERFYEILKHFKQVSTNIIGSHVFYAVEMGLPVSLVGPSFTYNNNNDPYVPAGLEFNIYKENPSYIRLHELFSGFHTVITSEQKEIVEEHLGVNATISRFKMATLLYGAFVRSTLKKGQRGLKNFSFKLVKKLLYCYPEPAQKALRLFNRLTPYMQKCALRLAQAEWGVFCRPNTTDHAVFEQVFYDFSKCFHKSDAKIIVDAGANVGFSSVWFARKYKDALVYAIEPNSDNYRVLEENCKAYPNIIPIHGAISNRDGEMFCVDIGDGEWAYVVSPKASASSKAERCAVFSMQSFINKYNITHIDIFKIDIEGSECELFDCSAASWIPMCDQINIEPHDWLTTQSSRTIFCAFNQFSEYACHVAGEHFIFIKKHD